jgi:hypothetical protein
MKIWRLRFDLCDLNLQSWWLQGIPPKAASSSSLQKIVKKCIYRLDEVEWREALDAAPARPSASGFSAHAHYQSFKTSYGAESYLSRGNASLPCLSFTCEQEILVLMLALSMRFMLISTPLLPLLPKQSS